MLEAVRIRYDVSGRIQFFAHAVDDTQHVFVLVHVDAVIHQVIIPQPDVKDGIILFYFKLCTHLVESGQKFGRGRQNAANELLGAGAGNDVQMFG